jgi:Tol biopolymer transport system component
MPDQVDTRLRELAMRVAEMAPQAPPFPETAPVRIKPPRHDRASRARRPLVWFAAAAAVVLMFVGLPLLLSSGDSEPPATQPQPAPTTAPQVVTTTGAQPTPQPAAGVVVVPGGSDGPVDIYAVVPGETPVNLTNHTGANAYAAYPSLSPDGTRILFEARRDGLSRIQVYSMNPDGTDVVRLSRDGSVDVFGAHWSPDGSKILVVKSNRAYSSSPQGIWVMNADGSGEALINDDNARGPFWSPDGMRIAFYLEDETWVAPIDGGDAVRITDVEASPIDWSPDASTIVVEGSRDAEPGGPYDEASDLWLASADGTDVRRLTQAPGRDWGAQWSPNGSRILFTSNRDGDHDIYVVDSDGANLTRLSSEPGNDGGARWSADGSRILFFSERAGSFGLYVMDADGSNVTPLWPGELEPTPTWFLGIDWSG